MDRQSSSHFVVVFGDAGGARGARGRGMGGPKSRLVLGGRPILDRLCVRFARRGSTLLVTSPGNEWPPGWERFGAEVTDECAGEGPLRGAHGAGKSVRSTEVVAVVTVDMPGVGAGEGSGWSGGWGGSP